MQFHVHTFLEFFGASLFLLAAYALIGAPVKILLDRLGVRVGRAVSAPVIGVAVVVLASWYWELPEGGTKPLCRILVGVGAVALAAWSAVRLVRPGGVGEVVRDRRVRESAALAGICFVGLGVVTTLTSTRLFTETHQTVLSLGNNDAPSYALEAQVLLDKGPRAAGGIEGYSAGVRSLGFATGAYSALASAASVTGQDVWKIMQPDLFVTLVLGAYALALLLREIFEDTNVLAMGIASVSGFSVLYVAYLAGEWFFSQLLGMVLVISITALLFRGARALAWRERLGTVGVVALLLAAGFAVYPHMVVFGSTALLAVSAVAHDSFQRLVRRALVTVAVFAGAFAAAAAAAPGLLRDAVRIARELNGVDAGWPLPAIYPSEMLGFQTSVSAKTAWPTVLASALLVAAVLAAGALAWRRGLGARTLPLVAAIAVILVSYAAVYQKEGGPSYRQWKWITFFVPVFVVSSLALVVLAVLSGPRRQRPARLVGYGVLLAHLTVAVILTTGESFPFQQPTSSYLDVTLDQIDLAHNPKLASIPALHLNTRPYWETMWLAYFLRDKRLSLAPPTYYSRSAAPISRFWLERNDLPAAPGARITKLNETYRLVQTP